MRALICLILLVMSSHAFGDCAKLLTGESALNLKLHLIGASKYHQTTTKGAVAFMAPQLFAVPVESLTLELKGLVHRAKLSKWDYVHQLKWKVVDWGYQFSTEPERLLIEAEILQNLNYPYDKTVRFIWQAMDFITRNELFERLQTRDLMEEKAPRLKSAFLWALRKLGKWTLDDVIAKAPDVLLLPSNESWTIEEMNRIWHLGLMPLELNIAEAKGDVGLHYDPSAFLAHDLAHALNHPLKIRSEQELIELNQRVLQVLDQVDQLEDKNLAKAIHATYFTLTHENRSTDELGIGQKRTAQLQTMLKTFWSKRFAELSQPEFDELTESARLWVMEHFGPLNLLKAPL